jgi:hypothetical protein
MKRNSCCVRAASLRDDMLRNPLFNSECSKSRWDVICKNNRKSKIVNFQCFQNGGGNSCQVVNIFLEFAAVIFISE